MPLKASQSSTAQQATFGLGLRQGPPIQYPRQLHGALTYTVTPSNTGSTTFSFSTLHIAVIDFRVEYGLHSQHIVHKFYRYIGYEITCKEPNSLSC